MKIINITIQVVFIVLLLAVAALFLLPLLPIDNNIQLRIVESGSMEPSIMTGSLVVIVPAAEYKVGDVVTFKSTSADVPTTHRIIESSSDAGNTIFTTKGDANEEADSAAASASAVIGKVVADVPYAGFILDFARQPIGFALLILLPAFMIIVSEIEKIWLEVRGRRKLLTDPDSEESEGEDEDDEGLTDFIMPVSSGVRMMDVGTPVQYRVLPTLDLRHKKPFTQPMVATTRKGYMSEWATICLIVLGSSIFVSASFLPSTVSYFNDIERSFDNTLKAVMLDFTVSSELNSFNFLGTSLDSENSSVINVVEPEKGSVDARYDIKIDFTGGSPLFCSAILADMTILPTVYIGPLLALAASNVDFTGPWSLVLSLDENIIGYLPTDFCQVDIVYTAWHHDESSDTGFYDEERVPMIFYATGDAFARTTPSTELLLLSVSSGTPEVVEEQEGEEELPVEPEAGEVVEPVILDETVELPPEENIVEPQPEEVIEPTQVIEENPVVLEEETEVEVVEIVEEIEATEEPVVPVE